MAYEELKLLKDKFGNSFEFAKTLTSLNRGESVLWNSCVGSSYAMIAGVVSDNLNRPIIVVVSKVGMVEKAAQDLKLFTDAPVLSYPILSESVEENPEELFPSEDADFGARIRVLKALGGRTKRFQEPSISSESGGLRAPIIVSTLAALLQPTPSQDQITTESVDLKVGDVYSLEKLRDWLANGGFVREPAVEHSGEFSIRGDICDVFALDWENPIRIEFFGDQVESIRFFDVVDQRRISELNAVTISSLKTRGLATSTFLEHLPNDVIVLIWEPDLVIAETTKLVSNSGTITNKTPQNTARRLSISEAMNALYKRPTIHAVNIASGAEPAQVTLEGSFFSIERLCGDVSAVDGSLKQLGDEERIIFVCASDAEATRLKNAFETSRPWLEGRLGFQLGALTEGFEWRPANTIIVGTDQLFNRAISRRTHSSQGGRKIRKAIDSIMDLEPGDLVVHIDHGIARYRGIEKIQRLNQVEDHLRLEFDGKALLVPVSQIGKIQRYFGVGGAREVKLSKLSGKAWNERKERVRQSVIQYAAQMLEVQAARESLCGVAFEPNGEMLQGFESTFPYRETEDQLTALDSVTRDMEKSRPMDRLLCGDVGFGKTEVAMRAAIKAVESGYQAAILTPTTVLTEQHYRTFVARAVQLPIRIASLSRFSRKEELSETLARIKSGEIDVVVGTHRLLSKDVQFKNLGLVIIDEEQKFGVRHKEQLKHLHNTVDVLTMTATPIPRTLHMAMLGIRDISNLETPPEDRLPVETRIVRSNDQVTRRAILRELNRGGQVYYLHNRVMDIESKAAELRTLVPEARIVVGHAQMATSALERIMRDFVMHKFDVLLCTTIVESGVDIPNANTIFIDNADRFGVAELHQLRGRVGREKKQAYCYLYIDPTKQLTGVATRRLRALEQYAKLGSGFQIALKDLEIRGAGNILGVEQSGSLEAVGYEMYCDMLDAVVRAQKHMPQKINVEVEIDLHCAAFLPDLYIDDSRQKIDVYRRLARASTKLQLRDLYDEVCDRFGKPPRATKLLFDLAFLRIEAFTFRVKRISLEEVVTPQGNKKKLTIDFRAPSLMYRLQELLKERGHDMSLLVDSLRGYVDFPPDVFEDDKTLSDVSLINFVRSIFTVPVGDRQLEELTAEATLARSERAYEGQRENANGVESISGSNKPLKEKNTEAHNTLESQRVEKKTIRAPLADRLKALRKRN